MKAICWPRFMRQIPQNHQMFQEFAPTSSISHHFWKNKPSLLFIYLWYPVQWHQDDYEKNIKITHWPDMITPNLVSTWLIWFLFGWPFHPILPCGWLCLVGSGWHSWHLHWPRAPLAANMLPNTSNLTSPGGKPKNKFTQSFRFSRALIQRFHVNLISARTMIL